MLDNLMRLREPAAWAAIVVTAVSIVLALIRFVLAVSTGVQPFSSAAQDVALHAMSLPLVIVLVVIVWGCVFHAPLAGAGRIVTAAALVVTLGTLVTILGVILGVTASAGTLGIVLEIVGGLLDVVLKLGATITLWLIHRGLRGGRIDLPDPATRAADADADPAEAAEPDPEPAAPSAPAWTPQAVTGTAWASASDAAAGVPGSDGPTPGRASIGWQPVRRPAIENPAPADRDEDA